MPEEVISFQKHANQEERSLHKSDRFGPSDNTIRRGLNLEAGSLNI